MTPYLKKSKARWAQRVDTPSRASDGAITSHDSQTYPDWSCAPAPSRIHRLLLIGVAVASALAILISNISIVIQLCCWLILAIVFICQWRRNEDTFLLLHHGGNDDTINDWSIVRQQHTVHGKLLRQGYRSAGLLILVFQAHDESCTCRIPIWSDAVSAEAFSYLNLQLMLNTYGPAASEQKKTRR